MMSFGGGVVRPAHMRGSRLSINVVASCSNTFVSMVTKDKPKVSFVTEGGNWSLQQRAKLLEKFVEGQFYESSVYQIAPMVALDGGGIFGTGWMKCFIRGAGERARIVVERVLPWEIQIDDQDGQYGKPMTLYQRKWVDRFVLMRMYRDEPKKLDAIRRAKRSIDPHSGVANPLTAADQILVTEAWRLPSDDGDDDGRHAIVISTADLEDEEWPHPWFPFVTYQRQECPVGSWGISLADSLEGIQVEINTLLMRGSVAMRRCGAVHVLVPRGANVNTSKLDNDEGTIVEYDGPEAPTMQVAGNVVPAELYPQLDRLNTKAYEQEGIPQAQAQGDAPNNLESGKAYQTYLQATDRRMIVAIDNYHEMFRQLALRIVELGRIIVEDHNPKYAVKITQKRGGMKRVFFNKAQLDAEEYVLKLWPTNALSDEPGARMGQVEKLSDAGWIAPDQAKRLLNMPDTEMADDLENSSYDAVEDAIAAMLEDGRWKEPSPMLNIAQAQRQVQNALNKADTDGAPEDRMQLLRDYLTSLGELTAGIGEPEAPQTMASAGGTPVAAAPAPGVTPQMMGGAPPGPGGPAMGAPPPPG